MPDLQSASNKVSQILRDWEDIPLMRALLVLLVGISVALAIRWIVPAIAARLPERMRFRVLPWEPILRVAVLIAMGTYLLPLFIQPTPENLLAISATLAVAFGFAFKEYTASLLAGIIALYEGPYRNGDWVTIEDTYGEVQAVDMRTVKVLTPDDTLVSIPHSKIWSTAVGNHNSGQRDLMCVAEFFLHPDHDGESVRKLLHDVALSSPYVRLERNILVIAAEKPWGTRYRVKAYPIDGRDQFQFISDLTLRGKSVLRSRSIAMALSPVCAPYEDGQPDTASATRRSAQSPQ